MKIQIRFMNQPNNISSPAKKKIELKNKHHINLHIFQNNIEFKIFRENLIKKTIMIYELDNCNVVTNSMNRSK